MRNSKLCAAGRGFPSPENTAGWRHPCELPATYVLILGLDRDEYALCETHAGAILAPATSSNRLQLADDDRYV
jgi:hypothetical protein